MKPNQPNTLRVLYFLFFCCTASWLPLLADYCKSKGLTGTQISTVLSITPVMMFVVQPIVGMIADRIGYKKTVTVSSLFSALSYLGYLIDGNFTWLVVVTLAMSFFYNGIQPVLDSLALQVAAANKGFSFGSLRIAGAAGWALTGIVAGQLIDAKSIQIVFIVFRCKHVSCFLVFSLS